MTWTQVYMWTGAKRVPEVRWPAVSRKNQAPTARLREKPTAKWDTWCLGNRPNRPHALLGEGRLIFIPSGGEQCTHIHCCTVSWLQVQTRLSLWEIPPALQEAGVGKVGQQNDSHQMEDRPTEKTQIMQRITVLDYKCKSAIYRAQS